MSRLSRAISKGLTAARRVAGEEASARRKGEAVGSAVTVTLMPGRRDDEVDQAYTLNQMGVSVVAWLLEAATWAYGDPAVPHEPIPGDRFVVAGVEYEVMRPNAAEECWRWMDGGRTWRRVFTKEVPGE